MRIGIFNDFHLGHSGTDTWHNRLLFDHTEQVVRQTIEMDEMKVIKNSYSHLIFPSPLAL